MSRNTIPRPTKAQLVERFKRPGGPAAIRELERTMQQSASSAANRIERMREKVAEAEKDIAWITQHREMVESVLRDIAEITGEIAA